MHPRQMRETFRPVFPRFVYSIFVLHGARLQSKPEWRCCTAIFHPPRGDCAQPSTEPCSARTIRAMFEFEPYDLPPEAEALRGEARAFLKEQLAGMPAAKRARSWSGFN